MNMVWLHGTRLGWWLKASRKSKVRTLVMYGPAARLESIRILLAFVTHHDFKLYQMDVKTSFLNGPISELVYVEQPSGFEDPKHPNHVYKLLEHGLNSLRIFS
jgi:hypothetical protein